LKPGDDGGKTSQTLVKSWFAEIRGRGGKVVGTHQVLSSEGDSVLDVTLEVALETGEVVAVSTELLARLVVYVTFRPRNAELVLALRARCAQYSKELGLTPTYMALVMPGTVTMAYLTGCSEEKSWHLLGGKSGKRTARYSGYFANGVVPASSSVVYIMVCVAIVVAATWWRREIGAASVLAGEKMVRWTRAWRASLRVSGPFGLPLPDRGPSDVTVATWVVAGLLIAWCCHRVVQLLHLEERISWLGRWRLRLGGGA
jgi:hypothetical protein